MNILQRIFTDYYEEIKCTLHLRSSETENIDKMINCGDPSFGGAMYGCPHCGKLKFVPFRCHSRFCLPAETNILWNVLLPCPLSWLMSNTAIVSLRLMKIFVTFSWKTVLCSTTFSTLLPVSFHICSSKWTSQKLYTWFYYGSPYFWQGFKMESTYSLSHIRRWTQRWWVLASSPSLQLHLSA